MRTRRLALHAPIAAAILALASPAAAQNASDKAAAEALFEQAHALALAGKYAEACPKFAESLRLESGLGTMLWLADCYENNGQTASAWAQFKEAASVAALRRDRREQVAREQAAALEPKLSRLTVSVSGDAAEGALTVQRDTETIPKAQWGVAVPVDPGDHAVRASAPGRKAWTTTLSLARAASATVTVPALEPGEEPAAATTPAAPTAAAPAAVASPMNTAEPSAANQGTGGGTVQKTLGLAAAGVGLVAVGIGAYLGLHAKSAYDDSNANGHCTSNQCDVTGDQDRSNARGAATASTIAFAAGFVAIAGGAVLYFTASRGAPAPSTALSPVVGKDGASFVLTRTW